MEASPSRIDSFSGGGRPGSRQCNKPRSAAASLERPDVDVDAAALGESFSSSTASFIDMDPEELFSMRWTSDDADLGLPSAAGLVFADDSALLLLPCEPGEPSGIIAARDVGGSAYSSPAFHTARSTPASSAAGAASRRPCGGGARTLLATRRLLLRYLRFLAPLCRKARALRLPARAFSSAPRSSRTLAAASTTPARRSTSSAVEYWCHGNADTAVRDAILHCKKSLVTARAEC